MNIHDFPNQRKGEAFMRFTFLFMDPPLFQQKNRQLNVWLISIFNWSFGDYFFTFEDEWNEVFFFMNKLIGNDSFVASSLISILGRWIFVV